MKQQKMMCYKGSFFKKLIGGEKEVDAEEDRAALLFRWCLMLSSLLRCHKSYQQTRIVHQPTLAGLHHKIVPPIIGAAMGNSHLSPMLVTRDYCLIHHN
jgi:hypothetical protein